jgi:hypothetical protein
MQEPQVWQLVRARRWDSASGRRGVRRWMPRPHGRGHDHGHRRRARRKRLWMKLLEWWGRVQGHLEGWLVRGHLEGSA